MTQNIDRKTKHKQQIDKFILKFLKKKDQILVRLLKAIGKTSVHTRGLDKMVDEVDESKETEKMKKRLKLMMAVQRSQALMIRQLLSLNIVYTQTDTYKNMIAELQAKAEVEEKYGKQVVDNIIGTDSIEELDIMIDGLDKDNSNIVILDD